eukprot:CAMPEP_0115358844 /NCGR_PEP_ID=MMETSP0270-20121206/100867_1 /TAXON_ID=71861 /ORGANISM="Scrippsiella trochoidea, Strain CCMP3099" /LENGTH=150 /DNA_ID=CAMNT_0002781333 /DNA_START=38 /DNA_END=490 /DNA_ORIENTATION=+
MSVFGATALYMPTLRQTNPAPTPMLIIAISAMFAFRKMLSLETRFTTARWKAAGKMKTMKAPPTDPPMDMIVLIFGTSVAIVSTVTMIEKVAMIHSFLVGSVDTGTPASRAWISRAEGKINLKTCINVSRKAQRVMGNRVDFRHGIENVP